MEIFIGYIIRWLYQDSWPPPPPSPLSPPRPPKITINLKSCKNKTKNKIKYFPATLEKINFFYSSRKPSIVPLDKGLQWVSYSDRFRHIQTYPGLIQAYSEPCVAMAYLELWHIQNPDI